MPMLADFIFRHARLVLCLTAVFAVIAGAAGSSVTEVLESGGFEDPSAESSAAAEQLKEATGSDPAPGIVATVRTAPVPARSAAGQGIVARTVSVIRSEPLVSEVASLLDDPNPALVSRDGRETYVVAFFRPSSVNEARTVAKRIAERLEPFPRVRAGGPILNETQIDDQVAIDLRRVELIALPVLLLLSFIVFRGLVAAALPILIAVVAILTAFMVMRFLSGALTLSVFSLNLVTGLGLGLAIDYALFIVSRYREEIAANGAGPLALRRTMATAGRTVVFSGATVAVALLSLLVFPQRFLYSMGVGGTIVTLSAVAAALIALPAALALLGKRVNALAPARFQRSGRRAASSVDHGPWYRLARFVMRRPVLVTTVTALLLLLLTAPVLRLDLVQGDRHVLPSRYSARQVTDSLDENFAVNASTPLIATVDGPAGARGRLHRYAERLSSLPGVAEVVPPYRVGGGTWRVDVISRKDSMDESSQRLVGMMRAEPAPGPRLVTGEAAVLYDANQTLEERLPIAAAILAVTTLITLFLMTGSVLLPLKSLLMNVLTVAAAFGLLIVVFQEGNLEGLLGFTASGPLEQTNMVLLSIVVFGLSTDYGVFLLGRIKEAHDAGASNREAVALGLERTGRIVSAAALLFCVAIGTLVTSEIVIVKTLGLGAALAVLIDATLIRAFLVPALMVLMGRWNWWAPAWLRSVHARIGAIQSPSTLRP
jgi:RND superfamily putative drug exporter